MEIKLREAKVQKSGLGTGLSNYGDSRHSLGNENKSQVPKMEGRYITGLDKYTPSIRKIEDKTEREKRIKELDKKRNELESRLGVSLDQDTPLGKEFWMEYEIDFETIQYLNKTSPEEELLMIVIKENSVFRDFPIALAKEDLGGDVINAKDYYVVDNEKELEISVTKSLLYAKCVGKLEAWFETDETKLRNIATMVLPKTIPISKSTPKGYILSKLMEHLDGRLYEDGRDSSKIKILKEFISYDNLPVEDLDVKATISKALRLNIISKNNSTGEYYNRIYSEYRYGKTLDEIHEYFKSPENQKEYGLGKKGDEEYSLKFLVNQRDA